MRKEGSTMRFGPVSHPQSTGQSENAVKLVRRELKAWAACQDFLSEEQQQLWYMAVPRINRSINSRYHRMLQTAPSMIMLGWDTLDGHLQRHSPRYDIEDDNSQIQTETARMFTEERDQIRSKISEKLARQADAVEVTHLDDGFVFEG